MSEPDVSRWRHHLNRWGIGCSPDGKQIRILGIRAASDGPGQGLGADELLQPMLLSRDHALELAAWIVAVSMPEGAEFERILAHVRGEVHT